jgi:hypothetical protein
VSEQELLAQLRDVQLPVSPGWWPPAIGWWVVAVLLLGLIVALVFWFRHWRANRWRRAALKQHQAIVNGSDDVQRVRELSVLMRRVALNVGPRSRVAAATDQAWLRVLDDIGQTRDYSEGVGKLLISLPYANPGQPALSQQLPALLKLTRQTIQRADLSQSTSIAPVAEGGVSRV